jgi:hypothetical protein
MGAIKEQREENIRSLTEFSKGFSDLSNLITSRLDQMATVKAIRRAKEK